MADEIHAKLVLDDHASKALDRVKGKFEEVEDAKNHASGGGHGKGLLHGLMEGSGFSRMKESIISGGVAGLTAAATEKAIESVKEEYEKIKEGISEVFQAGVNEYAERQAMAGVLAMTDKAGGSYDMLLDKASFFKEDLEDMGITAGASAEVMQQAFSGIVEKTQLSANAALDLTGKMAEAGKAIPGGVGALSQGFEMLSMGVVRARNPIVGLIAATGTLHGNAKSVAAQLQKMPLDKQMKLAEEAIDKMAGKMKDVAPTYAQLQESLKGIKEQLLESMGMPMVKEVVPALTELKDALVGNKGEMVEYAGEVGKALGEMTHDLAKGIKEASNILGKDADKTRDALKDGASALKDVGDFFVTVVSSNLKITAMALSGAASLWASAKEGMSSLALAGVFGDDVKKGMLSSERTKVGTQLESAAVSPDADVRAKVPELAQQYRALTMQMGLAGSTADAYTGQIGDTASKMGDLQKSFETSNPLVTVGTYNALTKAHADGMQAMTAGIVLHSAELQEALIKSGLNIEGGFEGMIEASKRIPGVTDKDREDFAERIKKGSGAKEEKIVNFNGPITVHQDFRDTDPDRVALVFKRDLTDKAMSRVDSMLSKPFSF